ncbi:MAG: hypothetical protein F4Y39_13690 [Gemmatimonadetes bacterium]|nr:hypothetical protein [Gemmatimonadota bacterium]MYF74901.1 hypothetical protein [Gemmatimonadota bacterium]MYK51010.1 hypothetical protein [Gemmatimonadota bacterium]
MTLSAEEQKYHERLKEELQQEGKASNLEHLAAALLSRLLDVPFPVAESGYQHGGDAGTAGHQGRKLRLECKKYSDTRSLGRRELLGEIDQALERDQALEAWILVATRPVREALQHSLVKKGESIGVPIIIIDWSNHGIAQLAALCAFAPDLVEKEFSKEAGEVARALHPISKQAIERLQRDLQYWCLGYDALRALSHEGLDKIWNSPRESNAKLGQDAAGGAQEKKVKRSTVHEALNTWWYGPAHNGAPVAVVGLEGIGKTWATLDWLIDKRDEQPIVLVIPSSAVVAGHVSETSVKQILADRLYEMSKGIRDRDHWLRRLENLLKRPTNEGPVLTVFFDGLIQESSTPWLHILKILQGETFKERVRIITTTRSHHYKNKLSELRGLTVSSERVDVGPYDTAPGSELDQMLAFENLTQAHLHDDVIELARNPRLFKLVVRFRKKLVKVGQVTVHRLLWEYGRDYFGVRAGRSFSEDEWREWLKKIAQQHRNGIKKYSEKSLGKTVARPDLEKKEVYARLSDIIDGPFTTADSSSNVQLTPAVVAHALGAALLNDLNQEVSPTFETLNARLAEWFDPISGLDERAEILRAAVSILVEQGRAAESLIPGVLVTAWLQSQNVSDEHRQELADLAPNFPDALLDAIEHSDSYVYDSARFWAVNALRNIPKKDTTAFTKIIQRSLRWMSIVSRDVDTQPNANKERDKRRSDRLKNLIGIDSSQRIKVCGVELDLVDHDTGFGAWQTTVPSIIEVFPLSKALPIFEIAAIALAVRGQSESWDGLKWICLLNEVDPDDTVKALRNLSEEILFRPVEPGIHPDLPKSVASLLLRLTGHNADEDKAVDIDPDLDRLFSYEKDYLQKPGQSWFPLERRHAEIVLADTELSLTYRVQRTKELWLDPNFKPPDTFIAELRKTAEHIDVEKLDRVMGLTSEDHDFEVLEPVLARCAPDLLADLIRRKMRNLSTCPPEFRQSRAILATNHLILADEAEIEAVRNLRLISESDNENTDAHVTERLLLMEFQSLDAQSQFDLLLQSDLEDFSLDFCKVLRRPSREDIDALITRYATCSSSKQRVLLILLSSSPVELTDNAWSWVESFVKKQEGDFRRWAFEILACANPVRFGRTLVDEGWSWSPGENIYVNHYGTSALIEATSDIPFDELAPRLAPWQLLNAIRRRGTIPTEVRLAAKKLGPGSFTENIRIDSEDFKPVFKHAMDIVEQQLESYFEMMEVSHYGLAAENFFLVLCEALLTYAPEKGTRLWHKLRSALRMRYIGEVDVERLMHMAFKGPDSPEIMRLREELVGLEYCYNDQKLFELAITASYNGKSDWLDTIIKKDRASALVWHLRRAEVLSGFSANNSLPVAGAWPDSEIRTTHANFTMRSARHRWIEACAHHWWRAFLNACDPAEAYAAWVLFLHSADRRAWVWIYQDLKTADDSTDFFQRKINHFQLNKSNLKTAMKNREGNIGDKLDQHFLCRKTVRSTGPWFGR